MKIARIFGIDIILEFSFLILLALVVYAFYTYFSSAPLQFSREISVAGALAAAVLFALSILFHEMAHSLVAKREGLIMESISFHIFGGIAQFKDASTFYESPEREFRITVAGPLSSFLLAGIFFAAAHYIAEPPVVYNIFKQMAMINLFLGGFNLIPGFPADGGRILRSIVWKICGSLLWATEAALIIGFAAWSAAIVLFGVFYGLFGALWIGFVFFALMMPAGFAERRGIILMEKYRNTLVKEVMEPITYQLEAEYLAPFLPERLRFSPDDKVLDVLQKYPAYRVAVPVVDDRNLVVGTLRLADLYLKTRRG